MFEGPKKDELKKSFWSCDYKINEVNWVCLGVWVKVKVGVEFFEWSLDNGRVNEEYNVVLYCVGKKYCKLDFSNSIELEGYL